jgi:membrane fusion protein, multidrug efflux system
MRVPGTPCSARFLRVASKLTLCALLTVNAPIGLGQDENSPPATAATASETQPALIERLPLVLRNPQSYQTPLSLRPVTSIELVAHADGVVSSIQVPAGKTITKQAEALRLEPTERQLLLDRAKAALQAAQAATGPQAAALLEVAKLDVRIAEHRLDQTIVRAPFDGTIAAIHVVPGQYVRAGEPLARLADLTKLAVELPVERSAVKVGGNYEIKIEDQPVAGLVQAIEPLRSQFEPLRELFLSVATAVVTVDNSGGRFSVGQTVYADLIPRAPVTEVPTVAIGSSVDGNRRVQVIREGFVRDVPVVLLGQAGNDYVFVSGRFGATDELVVKSSKELRDGMRVLPAAPAEPADQSGRPRGPQGNRRPSDF